jgi:hypothetical protein
MLSAVEIFTNQATTIVLTGGTTAPSSGTPETWTVASAVAFPQANNAASPPTQFHVADMSAGMTGELIEVTDVVGTTWYVVRGAEGTTPVAHASGFTITQVVTAGFLNTVSAGEPYEFVVEDFGAKGDGTLVSDGVMSSSVNPTHLACTTSNPFANAVAGMGVYVVGAGSAGADLFTTIFQVVDSGHVILTTGASTSVSGVGVVFGTDDTAALQAAINGAVAYAQSTPRSYAEVVFRDAIYLCNTVPTPGGPGGATKGNSVLTLPIIPVADEKVTLSFKGVNWGADALLHWDQQVPQTAGTVLMTNLLGGTLNATYWYPFILGGPYDGYGLGSALFSNMLVILDGITFSAPWNPTYGGANFLGVGEARVTSAGYMALGLAPVSSGTAWPKLVSGGPANVSYGLVMPDIDNNDLSDILFFSAEGVGTAVCAPEHVTFQSIHALLCGTAINPTSPSGSAAAHNSVSGKYLSCENCYAAVGAYNGGGGKVQIDVIDMEVVTYPVADSSDVLVGSVGLVWNGVPGYGSFLPLGATQMRIIYLDAVPGAVTAPTVPGTSGTPVQNQFYRDATVYVSSGGAGSAVTGINVNGIGTALSLGTSGTVTVSVPSGAEITLVYTGTKPSWAWFTV